MSCEEMGARVRQNPLEFGRTRLRCRRWCNSSQSVERLLVFYLISLHFYFSMVYASARPIPNGFSSLDCVNNGTGASPGGLPSNDTLSCNGSSGKTSSSRPTKLPAFVVIIIVIVLGCLSMVAIKLYFVYKKNCSVTEGDVDAKSATSSMTSRDMFAKTVSLRRSDVKRATRNFKKKIGAGGFGPVYHGKLPGSGLEVAVKVQANNSRQGLREFATEVEILSRARHPNLVSLIGYCEERSRCMLVYEYLPGGTLEDRLYGRRSNPPLDWGARLKIASQAARGLEYLHNDCVPSIIHRDVKSNNILLTKSRNAKLTDFGLSKSLEETPIHCSVKGTSGYLDPEYYESMRLTHKSDVYSFGIVLLELISARVPADKKLPREEWILADWVRNNLVQGKLEVIVDKALESNFNKQAMWCVAELAMTCVEPQSKYRPTISEVVLELEAVRTELAHPSSIAHTNPDGTPFSFRAVPSLAQQSQGSSITRTAPDNSPDYLRTTPPLAPRSRDSSISLSTPGGTPDSFKTAPSLPHESQDSSSTLSTPGGTPDFVRTASSLGPH